MAFVKVGDSLLSEELIRQGLAWVFTRYCDRPLCQGWKALEEEARKAKRGLWSMPKPVAPWEFRRGTRRDAVAKLAHIHQAPLVGASSSAEGVVYAPNFVIRPA